MGNLSITGRSNLSKMPNVLVLGGGGLNFNIEITKIQNVLYENVSIPKNSKYLYCIFTFTVWLVRNERGIEIFYCCKN